MVKFPSWRAPRPSASPPPAKRMPVMGGDRPLPPLRQRRRGGVRGRVVSVFGPPGVGVSTLLRVLHEESTTPTGLVVVGVGQEPDLIERRVREEQRAGVEVVLLDGFPRRSDDVQWLYDQRFVTPAGGTLVRLVRNAVLHPAWEASLPPLVQAIQDLSLPYQVVMADDPLVAATAVFNIAELE